MPDHGTTNPYTGAPLVEATGYESSPVAFPQGATAPAPVASPVAASGYRIAGTESGDDPIDRVQWFPRGDWDKDGD